MNPEKLHLLKMSTPFSMVKYHPLIILNHLLMSPSSSKEISNEISKIKAE